jgi:(p)ppGpp synthase/HD superfamily hydrolase
MPTLEDAVILAAEAHKEQSDKSGQPYILHVLRVMLKLDSEIDRIVGVLHDLIEDTPYTLAGLEREGHPEKILHALECLTKRKDEPYEQFVERVKTNPIARRVKIADLEDNMNPRRLLVLDMEALERVQKYHNAWRGLKNE